MKIWHIIRGINDGGAETLVKDYATLIGDDFKTKVVMLYCVRSSSNWKTLVENKIDCDIIYKKWNLFTKIFNYLFGSIFVAYHIKKLIKQDKPDVIHCHMPVLKYISKLGNNLNNIKLFYTCHSVPERYFSGRHKSEYTSAKKMLRQHHLQMIALHSDMAKELNTLFNIDNTIIIHNGINIKRFMDEKTTREDIRLQLGIPKDAFVIGHIGRFEKIKNHRLIFEVFESALHKIENCYLLLIGHGTLLKYFSMLSKDAKYNNHIIILSHRSDVPVLLKAMDVFIFPSIKEGLGIVMIEAQIAGLRCVASDAIPRDAIISDKVQVIKLTANIDMWSDALLMGGAAEKNICTIDDYNIQKEIQKLECLYRGD